MYYEIYNQSSELIERVPMSTWSGKSSALLPVNALSPDFSVLPHKAVKAGKRNETAIRSAEVWQKRPLVISFYCPCWGNYGTEHLKFLKKLHAPIQQAGGELWVVSNQPADGLARLSIGRALPFTLVADDTCTVARQFGVYSDTAPLWQLVSGVSEDAYTPAVFVIDTKGRIKLSQSDPYLEGIFAAKAIVEAVWQSRSLAFD
jgi:peroxiredoxin